MRRPLLQFPKNRVPNTLRITAQTRIPKTQFLDPLAFKISFPFPIVSLPFRMTVLETIQFNGEPCFLAKEIQDVLTLRMLTPEFV